MKISRRRFLELGGAAAGGAAAGSLGVRLASADGGDGDHAVDFYGAHQSGVVTPPQNHLWFAAFDVTADDLAGLRSLLESWSRTAARLAAGRTAASDDSGETSGLGPARLTVTFGLGPGLFDRRYGLGRLRPPALAELPGLAGDELDSGRSGGDLFVQACADDPAVAFHAARTLSEDGRGAAVLRWAQRGFRSAHANGVSRNLLGFRDGTNNLDAADASAMRSHVWADSPGWMRGGTYGVIRRVRIRIEHWDAVERSEQERTIGRRKRDGAPVAGGFPADSHVKQANPRRAGSERERILRRGYSFSDGIDERFGELDAGLFFVCFQRDPRRQFVPIQRRLATGDHLSEYVFHTGSAVFAVPPGAGRGSYVGAPLFEAAA
jgi:deferrochelatase/peroxidase EfeB